MPTRTQCPHCAEAIVATAVMCRYCHRGISQVHFKKCSFCAELIRRTAQKCRYCAMDVPPAPSPPRNPNDRPPHDSPVPRVPVTPDRETEVALPLPEEPEDIDAVSKIRQMKDRDED